MPVWHALSDLFLDTELQAEDYRRIAEKLRESGYSPAELRTMLEHEIAPAFAFNLLDVAGEWCSWSAEEVRHIMLRHLCTGGGPPPLPWLKPRLFRRYVAGEWAKIEALLSSS